MSEVKVNKITPTANCGTVTLGDSGDTFTIPSGVTLSSAGSITNSGTITNTGTISGGTITGTIDGLISWDTTAKTTGFTAVAGNGYFVNTTSGAITVTLPATPTAGDLVGIKDYANTADTNNITIDRNGSNIQGVANNYIINTAGRSIILIYVDGTQGWVSTGASQASDISENKFYVTATGGTITTCGNYKIHTFTGPGTFCVSCAGNPAGSNKIDYVVVAGGGGGGTGCSGQGRRGGGGGAGGYRESHCSTTSGCYTASPLATPTSLPVSVTAYPITIGGGGASSTPGSNSVFSTITSAAGGAGGDWNGQNGDSGGAGGGGGPKGSPTPVASQSLGGTGNTPPVSPPQGNNGGSNPCNSSETNPAAGGGGGGALGAGMGLISNTRGGAGGAGAETNIPGSPLRIAGGGGGGGHDPGGGGGIYPIAISGQPSVLSRCNQYGGGNGEQPTSPGGNGGGNTGGGAGGAWNGGGYSGGSGIVIIRYKYQN